jgi:Protein of unknown function (DUF1194)
MRRSTAFAASKGVNSLDAGRRRRAMPRVVGWLLMLALTMAVPAMAQTAADLQLVLAVDASGSVDPVRFELQKRGYVAAFRHARVLQAIRSGPNQAIAVTMVQWTGPMLQVQVVGWTLVGDEESAAALAAAIERAPRQLFGGGTSISGAIDYATTLFPRSPFRAIRRVIDVSGDGPNNAGVPVVPVRDELVAQGVVINGLPIMLKLATGFFDLADLDRYYADCVIGGTGAFMIPIKEKSEFQTATRRKLLLEIAGLAPPARLIRVQAPAEEQKMDCMVGERQWRRYMDGRFPN